VHYSSISLSSIYFLTFLSTIHVLFSILVGLLPVSSSRDPDKELKVHVMIQNIIHPGQGAYHRHMLKQHSADDPSAFSLNLNMSTVKLDTWERCWVNNNKKNLYQLKYLSLSGTY